MRYHVVMTKMMRATVNAVLTVEALDGQVTVEENRSYDIDTFEWGQTLKEHPWAFDTDAPIEAATAAPGEKRSTRRPA